jgi:hypothetical protein
MHHRNDLDAAAAVLRSAKQHIKEIPMRMATVAVVAAAAAMIVSSASGQMTAQPNGTFWSAPIGYKLLDAAPVTIPDALQNESQAVMAETAQQKSLAAAIIDREEKASGRSFDPSWRDAMLERLSMKPVTELQERLADGSHGLIGTPQFLGSTQADLSYTPVAPCRIIDTRAAGGQIAVNTSRSFRVTGTGFTGQGGTAGNCGVPFGAATAAVINFTAVGAGATGPGSLAVTASGSAFTTTSIINWTAGVNVSNAVSVALCDPNVVGCATDFDLKANTNSVSVVADVLGYYAAPQKTSVEVQSLFFPAVGYSSCPSLFNCNVTVQCNTGYTITGGGCEVETSNAAYLLPWYAFGPTANGWICKGTNTAGVAQGIRVFAMCTRTFGRN